MKKKFKEEIKGQANHLIKPLETKPAEIVRSKIQPNGKGRSAQSGRGSDEHAKDQSGRIKKTSKI
jgi:hypothetical protein